MAKKNINPKAAAGWPPWYQQCLDNIKKIPGAVPCPQEVCTNAPNGRQIHMLCTCQPPYLNGCLNNPTPGCCAYGPSSPIFVISNNGGCYCCCGNVYSYAAIATGKNNSVSADQLKKGDMVYAPKDASLKEWSSVPLQFVSFSNTSAENAQVSISYRDAKGKEQQLIVPARQLMLLPGKKFKEAQKLVPGIDQLVNKDGKAVDIETVLAGTFTALVAYISSVAAPAADPEGHLLSIDGFIAGDYSLSLGIGQQHLTDNHEQLPNAGTTAYKERYPHLH